MNNALSLTSISKRFALCLMFVLSAPNLVFAAGFDSQVFLGAAPEGDLYVVLSTSYLQAKANKAYRVRENGEVVWEWTIEHPGRARVEAVAWLEDSPMMVGTRTDSELSEEGLIWYSRFSSDGTQAPIHELPGLEGSVDTAQTLAANSLFIACAADKSANGEADELEEFNLDLRTLRFELPDKLLWDRRVDVRGDAQVVSSCLLQDKSYLVLSNAGAFTKFGCGESEVLLIRYSPEGDELKRATLPERQAFSTLVSVENGAFFAFSRDTLPPCEEKNPEHRVKDDDENMLAFLTADSVLVNVDSDLQVKWERELPPCSISGYPKMVDDGEGGCVVVSAAFGEISVIRFSSNGDSAWAAPINSDRLALPDESGIDDVLIKGDQVLVLCSAEDLDEDTGRTFALLKLSLKTGAIAEVVQLKGVLDAEEE